MTKINRLSIQGFKSFARKTDIPFGNRYNCILGPNGSGKSNLGDALCFVLGRLSAKSLRAEKAANLIFNGGKKHKPSSSGTVEIEFDNQDGSFPVEEKHVLLSRTITKKGSSIYRINNKKRTRTEIVDLLSAAQINPSGYNIVLQGDITRFVDMPSVERRKIIEQISDISHYEEKKKKALLELEKVEDKLNNAKIIMKERKAYLRELKKDRDQALKFKELKDEIDSYKATYLNIKINSREGENTGYNSKIKSIQEKISNSENKIDSFRSIISQKRDEIKKINDEIEQKGEKDQVKLQKEIEGLKEDLIRGKTRVSTLKDEINKIELRKDQFQQEIKELRDKNQGSENRVEDLTSQVKKRKVELAQIEKQITDFKKKQKIGLSSDLEKDLAEKDKIIDQKQEEVQRVRQQQQDLFREKDRIEYQLETIDDQIKKVAEVNKEHKGQIKILQQKKSLFKNSTLQLNKCLEQDSSYASQLANARRKLVNSQDVHAKLNAKTRSFQVSMSQNRAVNALLSEKKKFPKVFGTIAQLGQVNKKYSAALEAAAGARTNFLVVEDDRVAADCINYLKSNKLGSASFIPLNKIKYREISSVDRGLLDLAGVHDFALNLISYSSQFKKAFSYVFSNTLIVEDLTSARKVGIGKAKMVTLDGNIAESSGVMKGGFRNKKGVAAFQEKDSLEKLNKLESEMSEQQSIISNLESKREINDKEITNLRKEKGELEGEIISMEKSLHLDNSDLNANEDLKKKLIERLKEVEKELSDIGKKVTKINITLAELKSKKQMLRSELTSVNNPRVLAQLSAFEENRRKYREEIISNESDLKNLELQIEQMIAPELNKIQEIIKQHEKEKIKFSNEIIKLDKKVKGDEKELKVREENSKEFYKKYKEMFNRREKFNTEISNAENKIESIRDSSRVQERELNLHSLKNAEVKAKLSVLKDEFEKYKDVKLIKGKSEQELFAEISKSEAIIGQMNAVNMKALEIYEQVEEEYNKLVDKKQTLHDEKTDVLTLMNEIETKKKGHFMKTFDKADKHFQVIFSKLFKKGDAFLHLEDPENPFEGGLTVKVKLTGKRHMDIKSLSGGEKTLTALSFIFAIQEYQPARFYIFDEIDAALDKHNAERLAKLIESYSDNAQYIVISHNDSVIAEADNLYGISMDEGISKVTSLKI